MRYDYIFIGSGCASLSLLREMAKQNFFREKRILLIDPSEKTENDRTWCFWSENDFGYKSANQNNWQQLMFKSDSIEEVQSIAPLTYYHIKGLDFYNEVTNDIKPLQGIDRIHLKVDELFLKDGQYYVTLGDKTYTADYIFNSVPQLTNSKAEVDLWQHFFGYRISLEKPFFSEKTVSLMDFSLSDNKRIVQFGYILPFSKTEALVEFTEFSSEIHQKEVYQEYLEKYLDQLGATNFTINEEELGKIPMTDTKVSRKINNLIHLGTAGNMTKPTTGYTFRNIQLDAKRITKNLLNGDLKLQERGRDRFSFYDRLLLGIIKDEPQKVERIMQSLFSKNRFTHILKFLDEDTSLIGDIKIFLSIPWAPFLKQLIKK